MPEQEPDNLTDEARAQGLKQMADKLNAAIQAANAAGLTVELGMFRARRMPPGQGGDFQQLAIKVSKPLLP